MYPLTASYTTILRVVLALARERGKRWASVVNTKSSMFRELSPSSANNKNRYLNVSAPVRRSPFYTVSKIANEMISYY